MKNILLTLSVFILFSFGCGAADNVAVLPQEGVTSDANINGFIEGGQRKLIFVGRLTFDATTGNVTYIPERGVAAHWDVTPYLMPPECDDCLTISVLDFDPSQHLVELEISLRNPTHLTAYDVRGIAMIDDPDTIILNADSYTGLWDQTGPVTINPFGAFAKDSANREFPPDTEHAINIEIKYSTFSNLIAVGLVVDASWPGNCKEPYEIADAAAGGVFLDYGSQDIQCDVLSWNADVSTCTIDLSCLGLAQDTTMINTSGHTWVVDGVSWHHGGKGPGTHKALISAKCAGSEIWLYNYVDIVIDASPPQTGWALLWGGIDVDYGFDVALDSSSDIYVIGNFCETVDFDPGPGVEEYHDDWIDLGNYITKFSSSGEHQWARTWHGLDSNLNIVFYTYLGNSIEITQSGSILALGNWIGGDLDPGPGEDVQYVWIYLSKFDTEGSYQWGKTWGLPGMNLNHSSCGGLATDEQENIYVAGFFDGTVDMIPGDGTEEYTSSESSNAFIWKCDIDGNYQWTAVWGDGAETRAYGIDIDESGNIYVTGSFDGECDFDPGDETLLITSSGISDIYIAKFDNNGNLLWVKTWGGNNTYYDDRGVDLALDSAGNIYVTGYFFDLLFDPIDFDPGPGVDNHISNGSWDIFLCKYDPSGNYIWGHNIGGPSYEQAHAIEIDSSDNVIITGFFRNAVDFDPGPGTDIHTPNSGYNIFACKYSPDGDYIWGRSWIKGPIWGNHMNIGLGVTSDIFDNLYITGCVHGYIDFNPGPGEDIQYGDFYAFLMKLDSTGNW